MVKRTPPLQPDMNDSAIDALSQRLGATPDSQPSHESWWRTQSATMSLLKHAHAMIEAAEKRMAEQEERIARLEGLASTDGLTGLANRRGLETFFEREVTRTKRHDAKGGFLIVMDLDGFKPINDTYGHTAGDECLKILATKVALMIRSLDLAARMGGDEFAVVLTDTDPESGFSKMQQMQDALDKITCTWQGHILTFGASLGGCAYNGDSDFISVYDEADKALYANKKARKAGR